jgi:hypothetical protein
MIAFAWLGNSDIIKVDGALKTSGVRVALLISNRRYMAWLTDRGILWFI